MQRTQPLIPLSHDHQRGLVVCRRIREGLKRGIAPARITAYVQDFWRSDLERHLVKEEQFIFPLVSEEEPKLQQVLTEHRRLKAQIAALSSNSIENAEDILSRFATLLETHIRFEERILFPQIEREVPSSFLIDASRGIKKEGTPARWRDEFWKN